MMIVMLCASAHGQAGYVDSLSQFREEYMNHHEVVGKNEKQKFRFFPVDESFRVAAHFEPAKNAEWFSVPTSASQKKIFRVFGTVNFTVHDTLVKASIYQSQSLMNDSKYREYLVLMFTDKTTGIESYEGGRYLDLQIGDIHDHMITLDFNTSYNPYCAYVKGKYNCPIPPRENDLPVAITAGEQSFSGSSH